MIPEPFLWALESREVQIGKHGAVFKKVVMQFKALLQLHKT